MTENQERELKRTETGRKQEELRQQLKKNSRMKKESKKNLR
jgi:hypothetical protein